MLRGMNMAGLPGVSVQQVGWRLGGLWHAPRMWHGELSLPQCAADCDMQRALGWYGVLSLPQRGGATGQGRVWREGSQQVWRPTNRHASFPSANCPVPSTNLLVQVGRSDFQKPGFQQRPPRQ